VRIRKSPEPDVTVEQAGRITKRLGVKVFQGAQILHLHNEIKTGSSSQGMTAKDPGNFQKQYNSRITWDFQFQPCTEPELKSVGHSKNNTDEHCPKFCLRSPPASNHRSQSLSSRRQKYFRRSNGDHV